MHAVSRSTIHRRTFTCLLLLVVVCSSLFPKVDAEAATSPWLAPNPTFKKIGMVDGTAALTADMIGNQDCQPAEIITRPERDVPPQSKQSHDSCIVDTGFGAVSASGYLQRQGSDAFGYLRAPVGNQGVVGIPRTNSAIASVASSAHGAYVGFYDNLRNLVSTTAFNDTVSHMLPAAPSVMLTDHAGNNLGIEFSSLSFSSEGDWAVIEAPSIAMLRINTSSHQVLPFADAPLLENSGPAYRTAINADGRYAVVVSKTRSIFKLYDLSTCGNIPDTITGPVNCMSVNLLPFVTNKVKDYSSVASVRFRGDYTLELYINTSAGIEHALIVADGQDAAHFEYLALGDSFASGEGAYQYKSLTDTSANGCHVSLRSYPYLIAKQKQLDQMESVACSGAVIDDLINSRADYRLTHSQSKGKEDVGFDDSIFDSFLPGYRAQKLFVKRYTPKVITISAGGNDIGFSDIILRCLGTDTCYSHYEDRLELLNEISNQFNNLSALYTEIKHNSPESDRIYVIGYPQVADPFGNCALNVHLNYDELLLASTLVSHLNSVIKAAADHAGVTYLDTEDALHGNRLCETNSNHIAVNGLTIGNDILNFPYIHGPIAKESYHPNSLGHVLLKDKILALTDNFSLLNTYPKPATKTKSPDLSSPALKAPKANRPTRKVIHSKSNNSSVAKKNTKRTATTKKAGSVFKTGSKPKVVLDGGEQPVGSIAINPDDSITVEITLPNETTEGPHTIDVIGDNNSSEPVDVTETIVVGDPNGPCGMFRASGIDSDHDGIDDACDPYISPSEDTNQNNNSTSELTTGTDTDSNQPQPNPTSLQQPSDASNIQSTTLSPPLQSSRLPTLDFGNVVVTSSKPTNPISLVNPYDATGKVLAVESTRTETRGQQAIIKPVSNSRPKTFSAASVYKNPPRLDFLRVRNLFLIILIICLIVGFVIYKKRKERQ